ncbi:2-isopropylmalate synthase [Rhizobium johnstonii]|uniref:2-isopropylmalate synthase n=1 Tax=Rhizobium leguminosarum bv. viciae TaxID=387 RepID=A0A8G2J1P4_RHILV|nr:2-isopropylmalate synthase [Rhizobium leguminosarum]MBY5319744.1 2-isopropylmalate synthase [Rhizobium leguminosarum]MBY5382005.1 2-isopropylmalate synthase [Rhizobium leguminosarum]MCA2430892.1 2-isopropylmalate synthase [Rhizobium leguminosarum]NEH40781.1 2-isopropylmalate synthase [Rhizobium leguminosarum]NEH72001.1 2-isopropylmalate synthase [Rhizobium leguminosarum]
MDAKTQSPRDKMASKSEMSPAKGMPDAAVKYRAYPQVNIPDRTWPTKTITKAPVWCSVDLRDGNQALVDPMGHDRKARMFHLLIEMGFKEIEIGFPSASQTDFDFARWCVEEGNVPDDVSLQVLVQCRPELITRTFEALEGANRPIVHFYNSTSELQRRVVFAKDVQGIKQIAVDAAKMITDMATKAGGGYRFEYSPESFTGTELAVALEICNAVIEVVKPTPDNKLIINLPSTVEMATPNVYADQIEWMCRNLDNRENLIVSLHPHNDRGTGIAAAELALLAGADRVEGTLFGNGERTGNVDMVTMALNMFTQGVDPEIDCSNIERIKEVFEYSNQMAIGERHPYVGELVYTAFSGSHQDAINKGMKAAQVANHPVWEVPYLPIDPRDVGRSYEAIIRINSQSGKGGIAYILQQDYGLNLPRNLQVEFREDIQRITDVEGKELPSRRIFDRFIERYVTQPEGRLRFVDHHTYPDTEHKGQRIVAAEITDNGEIKRIEGRGNGPIDGFINALSHYLGIEMSVEDYSEHSLQHGSNAAAISYVETSYPGGKLFGAGINTNIVAASLEAIVSAANRVLDVKAGKA